MDLDAARKTSGDGAARERALQAQLAEAQVCASALLSPAPCFARDPPLASLPALSRREPSVQKTPWLAGAPSGLLPVSLSSRTRLGRRRTGTGGPQRRDSHPRPQTMRRKTSAVRVLRGIRPRQLPPQPGRPLPRPMQGQRRSSSSSPLELRGCETLMRATRARARASPRCWRTRRAGA